MSKGNSTYHWTAIFGAPEKIKEIHYIDDYGSWDSQFYRKDGTAMHFKPSPLELSQTKKSLLKRLNYQARVLKAISKVKY